MGFQLSVLSSGRAMSGGWTTIFFICPLKPVSIFKRMPWGQIQKQNLSTDITFEFDPSFFLLNLSLNIVFHRGWHLVYFYFSNVIFYYCARCHDILYLYSFGLLYVGVYLSLTLFTQSTYH